MRRRRSSALAPSAVGVLGLALLSLLYLTIGPRSDSTVLFNMNLFGPLIYIGLIVNEAIRLIRRSRSTMMTPIFAFYGSTAVYFGFGSIAPLVASSYTRDYLFQLGVFGDEQMLKYNLIVSTFTFVVLLTIVTFEQIFPKNFRRPAFQTNPAIFQRRRKLTLKFGVSMLVIGVAVEWFIFIPSQVGLFASSVPALFAQLINLAYVGIFVITYWCLDYRRGLIWIPLVITLFESGIGLLLFSKQSVLLPAMFFVLAVSIRTRSLIVAVAPLAALMLLFSALAPIVTHGRIQQDTEYGERLGAPLEKRLGYVISYFDGHQNEQKSASIQYNWVRISYIHWGIAVIGRYDAGAPGESLSNSLYVFVPRVFWPDKPNMAVVGADLYTAVTGGRGVSVSAGLFAEAYWNFGWLGGVILMPIFAVLLITLSRFSLTVLERQDWIYMPAVILAIRMGTRPDGHFVLDVFGAGVLIGGFIGVAWVMNRLVRGSHHENPAPEGLRRRLGRGSVDA